ncbi:hypothetical protein [Undibacterium luofuense]|uniref:hypothetical protein n=1 Tax=Undibacterium luofuense TaxID=2828733 RepID=UPI0030ECED57
MALLPASTARTLLIIVWSGALVGLLARVFWLGEGSAIILTDDLQTLGVPAIGRDDRRRAFDRLRVPMIASLSHATVIRLGQIVGAVQVVVGTFELKGDELTVRARAIRLDTGRITPEIESHGALADVFGVYAGIAQRLVPNASVSTQEMEQGHPPIAAFEQYVKGLLATSASAQVQFLTQAVRLAPGFAPSEELYTMVLQPAFSASCAARIT